MNVFDRWRREWTHRPVTGKDGTGDRKEICFKTVLTSLLQEPLHPVATHVPLASRRNLRHWSGTLLLTPELYLVVEDVNVHHSYHHYHQNSKPPSIIFRQKCTFSHICHLKSQLSFFFFSVCVFVSIFLNLGFACFNRKLTQEKGKNQPFMKKEKSRSVVGSVWSTQIVLRLSLSSTQRNKNTISCLFFFFLVIVVVYNLI